MPAILGAFKIDVNQFGAVLLTGDLFKATPTTSTKTYAGAGSFQTGERPTANVAINNTLVNDPDIVDGSTNKTVTGT